MDAFSNPAAAGAAPAVAPPPPPSSAPATFEVQHTVGHM